MLLHVHQSGVLHHEGVLRGWHVDVVGLLLLLHLQLKLLLLHHQGVHRRGVHHLRPIRTHENGRRYLRRRRHGHLHPDTATTLLLLLLL